MHGAALVALLGFLGAAVPLVTLLGRGALGARTVLQLLMAVLCGAFVVLCVRSFAAARRRRAAGI
ncbi:MAG: hypothetical protein ACREJG_03605 [Candidatus Rokuibacteriota bacterium]